MRRDILAAGIGAVISSLAITACAGSGSTSTGGPPTSPTPTIGLQGGLYISSSAGPIKGYALPVTAGSVPAVTFGSSSWGSTVDSNHRVFVATVTNSIDVYTQPIVNGAAPSLIITLPNLCAGPFPGISKKCGYPTDVALDAAGDVFVSANQENAICPQRCSIVDQGALFVFNAPVTSSSTPSSTLPFGVPNQGVALDRNGIAWTTASDGSMCAYPPPFGSPYNYAHAFCVATGAEGGIAFDSSGNLYASSPSGIEVYEPPFSGSMAKAFTISTTGAKYLSFDNSGGLYATTTPGLLVFSPPFSGASRPVIVVPINGAEGVAIGQ